MKTFILAATMALTSLSVMANNKTGQKSTFSFNRELEAEFGTVQGVSWHNASNKNMCYASFTQNDEQVRAFFSDNGEYIASTIAKIPGQLPAKLRAAIRKMAAYSTIIEALEFQSAEEICYYVKVNDNGTIKLYKGSSYGDLKESSLKF